MNRNGERGGKPRPHAGSRSSRGSALAQAIARAGLRHVEADALTIERRRAGRGFCYVTRSGRAVRDPAMLRRFKRLAVPPAYTQVRLSADPRAHLQAIGRDAANRLQYRYHPDWEKVRETRKGRRLVRLIDALPRIRRRIGACLAKGDCGRSFALAAVIALIEASAIRPGSNQYVREHGTRGAATLLKAHVDLSGGTITLNFPSKGGKRIAKIIRHRRLKDALRILQQIPGRRLFQYVEGEEVRRVSLKDANAFLRELAGVPISLKDFRTLAASAQVAAALAGAERASSDRKRRKQVLEAVRGAAEELANTAAICRKSYVHPAVVAAFERGELAKVARSKPERLLAEVMMRGKSG